LVIDQLILVLSAYHVLEGWQYEALNPVASVGQIICDHHADLMPKVPHLVDQNISSRDVQEKLKMILEVECIVAIGKDSRVDVEGYLVLYGHNIWLIKLDCLFFYLNSGVNTLILSSLKTFIFIVIKNDERSFEMNL
jgi:hypothetical protein